MGRKKLSKEASDVFDVNKSAKSLSKTDKCNKPKKEKCIQKLALNFINNPTERTFGDLCERINWGLRSYIFKIVKDDDATTEVITRTFENIYFKRDQFDPNKAQFSTWMYRIALNNSLKYLQELKNHNKHVDVDFEDLYDSTIATDADETSSNDAYTEGGELNMVYDNGEFITYNKERIISEFYDASVKSIQDLPDNLRIVMYDRLVNEKKIDDIAIDNQIPISSVKNWLRKGKIQLQEIIKEKYTDLYDMYIECGYSA